MSLGRVIIKYISRTLCASKLGIEPGHAIPLSSMAANTRGYRQGSKLDMLHSGCGDTEHRTMKSR